jgi:DNA-binding CsgD family transcriptional regulator
MPGSNPFARLTGRELQVLHLVARGLSSKEIGAMLEIDSRTVERHIDHVRLKTRARNRSHMVALAISAGCLETRNDSGREPG